MNSLIGQSLGRYHILEQLGKGGMAVVYKAYDTRLDKEVAVKVIRTENLPPSGVEHALKRFGREAKAVAQLTHPNIVQILDSGEENGIPYIVMDIIPGGTLKQKLNERRGKPFPWKEAAGLLAPVARALESAHHHPSKIIHRDVKPSNIMITQYGIPLLADFGIAKVLETEETFEMTATGVGIGTPEYMAPEQTGKGVDHRADIYSLGVVFFEMVTGQKPYQADTPMAVMLMKNTDPLPRPSKLVPSLPEAVEHVLFKALAKSPRDRYADMGDLAEVLEKLAQGILPKTAPSRWKIPLPEWLSWKVAFGAIGAIFIAVIALGVWIINPPARGENTPTATTDLIEMIENDSTPIPPPTSTPPYVDIKISPADDAELVLVPEGEFIMGSDPDEPYFWGAEMPRHTVYLDAFWIYRTEVTNAMFRACVDAGACPQPDDVNSRLYDNYFIDQSFDNYPVIHVTYDHAASYCAWAGARLPTEAEWEKAARGTDGRLFPWGNDEIQNDSANFCDGTCPALDVVESGYDDGYPDVAPVGSYPAGVSPYGAFDMAGNVLEWVSDWYSSDYYSRSPYENPIGPESGSKHPARGGSWSSLRDGMRPAARASFSRSYSSDVVGFRCVMDAP